MATVFELIAEDFLDETSAIALLVKAFEGPRQAIPKARVAAANSATLLLAATFEEFVRQMAKEYARSVVRRATCLNDLPRRMATVAWKRTMDHLGRLKLDGTSSILPASFGNAQTKFADIYGFCTGDLTKDIYDEMIHNDNNMRPGELNGLFTLSGVTDVFGKAAGRSVIMDHLGEIEPGRSGPRLKENFEDFFERRNKIAHSLNLGSSGGTNQILSDIALFDHFAVALSETLEGL